MPSAIKDLDNIYNYIKTVLKNFDAAKNLELKFQQVFDTACVFPYALPIYEHEENFRKISAGNFTAFVRINETKKELEVFRVLYSFMDIPKKLK